MTTQVFFQTVVAGFILWVMGTIWYALEYSTAYERFVLTKLVEASFKVDAAGGVDDPVLFHTPSGHQYWTSADWLMASPLAKHTLHKLELDLIHGALTPDRKRRLYCVIDELPTLQKLPSLSDFLARARKYGGCGILGFQSYPQLEATYGIQDAAAITGYCSTWVALRANDTPTAKHVSENLGQVEQVEANEGMSYGVNDMRDGVNLSRMQVTRPLVMHTEVTNLPNLSGFLRFGRNLPVVHFQDRFNTVQTIAEGFIERDTPPLRDQDGEKVIASIHADASPAEVPAVPRRKRAVRPAPPPAPHLFEDKGDEQVEAPSEPPAPPSGHTPVEPVTMAAFALAPQRGKIRIELDVYDRENGPARPARPA